MLPPKPPSAALIAELEANLPPFMPEEYPGKLRTGLRDAVREAGRIRRGRRGAGPLVMFDSTSLYSIPLSAQAVASYDTGYPQSAAAWARFAGKKQVHIVQRSGYYHEGDVIDIEPGCAGLGDIHPFIAGRKSQGYYRPSVYTSLSWVPSARKAAGGFILGVDYDLWVALWDRNLSVPYPGVKAKQYASYQSYDLSAVYDASWPYRTKATPPPPGPVPPPAPLHPVLRVGATGAAVRTLQAELDKHGAHLVVDGDFGPLTLAAVKAFQAAQKIAVDGIAGPVTWAHLDA